MRKFMAKHLFVKDIRAIRSRREKKNVCECAKTHNRIQCARQTQPTEMNIYCQTCKAIQRLVRVICVRLRKFKTSKSYFQRSRTVYTHAELMQISGCEKSDSKHFNHFVCAKNVSNAKDGARVSWKYPTKRTEHDEDYCLYCV